PAEQAEAAAEAIREAADAAGRLLFPGSTVDLPLDLQISERSTEKRAIRHPPSTRREGRQLPEPQQTTPMAYLWHEQDTAGHRRGHRALAECSWLACRFQ